MTSSRPTRISSASGSRLTKEMAAGMGTGGPWTSPLQSIEILIVICFDSVPRSSPSGASCGKLRTHSFQVDAFQNDGVQKRIAADEKRKSDASRVIHAAPPISGSSKSVDYSSFLVFRTL